MTSSIGEGGRLSWGGSGPLMAGGVGPPPPRQGVHPIPVGRRGGRAAPLLRKPPRQAHPDTAPPDAGLGRSSRQRRPLAHVAAHPPLPPSSLCPPAECDARRGGRSGLRRSVAKGLAQRLTLSRRRARACVRPSLALSLALPSIPPLLPPF